MPCLGKQSTFAHSNHEEQFNIHHEGGFKKDYN
jgi:hypothetical protein